jgi:hypothetical protein
MMSAAVHGTAGEVGEQMGSSRWLPTASNGADQAWPARIVSA